MTTKVGIEGLRRSSQSEHLDVVDATRDDGLVKGCAKTVHGVAAVHGRSIHCSIGQKLIGQWWRDTMTDVLVGGAVPLKQGNRTPRPGSLGQCLAHVSGLRLRAYHVCMESSRVGTWSRLEGA